MYRNTAHIIWQKRYFKGSDEKGRVAVKTGLIGSIKSINFQKMVLEKLNVLSGQ